MGADACCHKHILCYARELLVHYRCVWLPCAAQTRRTQRVQRRKPSVNWGMGSTSRHWHVFSNINGLHVAVSSERNSSSSHGRREFDYTCGGYIRKVRHTGLITTKLMFLKKHDSM